MARTADHWVTLDLDVEVVERACRPFPAEPIRTLDALHLATAMLARSVVPDLTILSLDERIRRSAEQMGLRVLPGDAAESRTAREDERIIRVELLPKPVFRPRGCAQTEQGTGRKRSAA